MENRTVLVSGWQEIHDITFFEKLVAGLLDSLVVHVSTVRGDIMDVEALLFVNLAGVRGVHHLESVWFENLIR